MCGESWLAINSQGWAPDVLLSCFVYMSNICECMVSIDVCGFYVIGHWVISPFFLSIVSMAGVLCTMVSCCCGKSQYLSNLPTVNISLWVIFCGKEMCFCG